MYSIHLHVTLMAWVSSSLTSPPGAMEFWRQSRTLCRWDWSCRILTNTLSRHNQSQWGFCGKSMLLCNPHVQEVAAPVGSVGQSLAGIPTEDIVPRQSSVVSSSTILQLCHRPVGGDLSPSLTHRRLLGCSASGQRKSHSWSSCIARHSLPLL